MGTQQECRKKIIEIFNEKPRRLQKTIARLAGVNQKTVSKVIKQYKESLSIERKRGSGRKKGFADQNKASKIIRIFLKHPNMSGRKVAQKVGCSESFVRKVKKQAGLKTFRVQKVPDRNARKNLEAKKRAKILQKDFFNKRECCVMDDETYVLADFSQLPGQEFYVADSRGNVEEKFRVQKKTKFPKKFLVWQAICTCGERSSSFITSGSINSDIYISECLQKRLLPFLNSHRVSPFFWPDLATSHYSKKAIEWYHTNNVDYVPKQANPPNCPELRPIERYWALVKRHLKDTKGLAKNEKDFSRKWKTTSKMVTKDTIKALMDGIKGKLKNFVKTH